VTRKSTLSRALIERAIKAAANSGLTVTNVEIDAEDGKIRIYTADSDGRAADAELQAWRRKIDGARKP
jgi:NAD(P)H-dependent FMN reductase